MISVKREIGSADVPYGKMSEKEQKQYDAITNASRFYFIIQENIRVISIREARRTLLNTWRDHEFS